MGPAANLSPQHLLALAASSCLMTTFLGLAGEAGVAVQGLGSPTLRLLGTHLQIEPTVRVVPPA
jgi:organic hydroperoxide reductase OsmC/OhrA